MRVLSYLVVLLVLAIAGNAQKSVLTGTIYDANGAVIVSASVVAIDAKNRRYEAKTNDDGRYNLSLPINQYDPSNKDFRSDKFRIATFEISVSAPYFETTTIKGYKFVPAYGGEVKLDVALDVKGTDPCHDPTACMPTALVEKNETPPSSAKILARPMSVSEQKQVQLSGKISDSLGVSLQRYGHVRASTPTGESYNSQSGDGKYVLRLPIGTYRLEAGSDGFCTVVVREFKISPESPSEVRLDFALPGATPNAPCVRYKNK